MSIFISVASYRDPALEDTLKSAVENASGKEAIKFGIVQQDLETVDLSFIKQYSLTLMHPRHARGVGLARSKAMDLYTDEDYYLQVDSHTIFSKNWDLKCIEQLTLSQQIARNKKVILSSFPPPYSIERNGSQFIHSISTDELPVEPTKQVPWLRVDNQWGAKRLPFDDLSYSKPELSTTVLGGFIFATGDIVKEVPYDEEISFFGEEICFAMRAWTRGWDIYSPPIPIVYHFYKRNGYKKIWSDEVRREVNWDQIQTKSQQKQKKVLCGIEDGIMGAGNVRSLEEYQQLIGYDFNKIYKDLTF
jgi:hypothetical protein